MQPEDLAGCIRQAATDQGFDLVGIAPAVTSQGYHRLVDWIDSGFAGGMDYFRSRLTAYQHPSGVLAGVRSIVVLSFPYPAAPVGGDKASPAAGFGKVARYACTGVDYHDVIHPKLKKICQAVQSAAPAVNCRGVVDTAPIMEREVAQLAGLGWTGKNTLLLNKHRGSYFFLACVLLDAQLPVDQPHASDHCGTCTACLEACPTDAFVKPGVMDASKCISYLTIEHRKPIHRELRPLIGDWIFGCDVCQEVCPWNQKHAATAPNTDPSQDQSLLKIDLIGLFTLDDQAFRQRFRKTAFWRTRRRGILRNAAIVLGNQRSTDSLAALTTGLADPEPLVRSACVWAIGQIGGHHAAAILKHHRTTETDPAVIDELSFADCKSDDNVKQSREPLPR